MSTRSVIQLRSEAPPFHHRENIYRISPTRILNDAFLKGHISTISCLPITPSISVSFGNSSHTMPTLNMPMIYMNLDRSTERRKNILWQLRVACPRVGPKNIFRVPATPFPKNSSKCMREYVHALGQSRMWELAMRLRSSYGVHCPGVLFLEDDMCFLTGWRYALDRIVSRHLKVNCNSSSLLTVRFDGMPNLEPVYDPDIKNDTSVLLMPSVSHFCSGGYFKSWKSIEMCISMFHSKPRDHWINLSVPGSPAEYIIDTVGRMSGMDRYVQCVPPLGIQDWFANSNVPIDRVSPSRVQHAHITRFYPIFVSFTILVYYPLLFVFTYIQRSIYNDAATAQKMGTCTVCFLYGACASQSYE